MLPGFFDVFFFDVAGDCNNQRLWCLILIVEISSNDEGEMKERAEALCKAFQEENMGYHFPIVGNKDIKKVWTQVISVPFKSKKHLNFNL